MVGCFRGVATNGRRLCSGAKAAWRLDLDSLEWDIIFKQRECKTWILDGDIVTQVQTEPPYNHVQFAEAKTTLGDVVERLDGNCANTSNPLTNATLS
jgi:hypothetical protein